MDVSDQKLISLPELPNSLETLDCYSNKLTSLPKLPDLLEYLDCNDNKITSLPKLPDTLNYLHCSNNKFEEPIKKEIIDKFDLKKYTQKKVLICLSHMNSKRIFR